MSGTVTVDVAEGSLRGKQTTSKSGFKYYSFKGIPYAKPPIGLLRFKVSKGLWLFLYHISIDKWMKVLQGGRHGYLSFWQWEEFQVLNLKLHVPNVPPKQKNQLEWNLLNLLVFFNNCCEKGAYCSHN